SLVARPLVYRRGSLQVCSVRLTARSTLLPYPTLFRSTGPGRCRCRRRAALRNASTATAARGKSPPWLRLPSGGGSERSPAHPARSEEHTSELQSRENVVCRRLLEKKNSENTTYYYLML